MRSAAPDLARRVLAATLLATLLGLALGAGGARAATLRSCSLALAEQDTPGGTPAFALTVKQRNTTCRTAKIVMRLFHRCRGEGGSTCARRVLARWTCRGRRVLGGARGLPRLSLGTFTCSAGRREVRGGYQELGPRCFGAAARDPRHPCFNPARTLTPGFGEIEPYALDLGASGCNTRIVAGACVWGVDPAHARRHVALVGDSHTYHWRSALALVAEVERWAGYSMEGSGCFFSTIVASFRPDCVANFYDPILGFLRAHPEIDTVFMASNADTFVAVPDGQTYLDYKVGGFRSAWQELPQTVRHIVVVRDMTITTDDVFGCVSRVAAAPTGRPGSACPLARSTALRQDTGVAAVASLHAERYQSVDLSRYFCGPRDCYPVIGGVRVNNDIFGHLTTTFTRTLGPFLLRAVRRLEAGW